MLDHSIRVVVVVNNSVSISTFTSYKILLIGKNNSKGTTATTAVAATATATATAVAAVCATISQNWTEWPCTVIISIHFFCLARYYNFTKSIR